MVEPTREQEQVAEALATQYDRVRVSRPEYEGAAIIVTCEDASHEPTRLRIASDGAVSAA
jgi:hypothetical protein